MPEAARLAAPPVRAPARASAPARPPTPAPAPTRSAVSASQPARLQSGPAAIQLNAPTPNQTPVQPGGGEPLTPDVRSKLGRSFGVDLGEVRVHTDERAQNTARSMSARAFTIGSNVYLGPDERPNDLRLLAHEVAHVVQQRNVPTVQRWSFSGGDHYEREAQQASAAVVQHESFAVHERATPQPQRWGISDALDYFANAANNIPGFSMLTFVLGFNPINMRSVERNATNLFRAIIGFLPGGNLIFEALQRHGIIDQVGGWVQQQLSSQGYAASSLRQALDRFLDLLSWTDIFDLGGVWDRAKRIFTEPIDRIISFLGGLVSDILRFIRDAILRPVARLAEGTRAYDLMRLVLGQDPITGDPYPRTPENMIGGFMRLIGQEEKWQHLQQSGAIPRAWAWFQQQVSTLLGFVQQIPQLFVQLWESLQISDLLDIGGAFNKVRNIFGGFVSSFISWAGEAALQLMMFIFEVLAPGAMPILRRAASVMRTIISDPIRFVGNLVRAGIQGFRQFAANIRTHLINGLVGWLTGALGGAGIQLPSRWDLRGILSLVLQILGLTWQNIRQKLVRVLGETAVTVLERTFDIVVTLVREGPAAAWQKILENLQNLQEMVFGQIRDWVTRTIVVQAVTRIASMLNPAGAVIQAIIAIYNTIMFVRERLQQIMQVAEAFFNSIAQIASGNIAAAASFVERTMTRLVPVVISFLARLIGLGGISDTIRNIIARIRAPIDRALDRVVEWIAVQARRLGNLISGGARGPDTRTPEQKSNDLRAAVSEATRVGQNTRLSARARRQQITAIKQRYRLTTLDLVTDAHQPNRDNVHVRGTINPTYDGAGFQISPFPPEPTVVIEAQIGPPQPRQGFEEVLTPPTEAGLPSYQRAHLVGAGFGVESPLGVLYAPEEVNQQLQNRGIEALIRGMYRTRFPGAEFFIVATAQPHAGTQLLARVVYELYGQLPGEPRTKIFEFRISVSRNTTSPQITPRLGEVDTEALSRYTNFVQQFVARRSR